VKPGGLIKNAAKPLHERIGHAPFSVRQHPRQTLRRQVRHLDPPDKNIFNQSNLELPRLFV
jgi:hypothetical protein